MYPVIDTHAHLEELTNLEESLAQAKAAGVVAIIAVGQDVTSNTRTLEIAAHYPGFVYPALGYHPWNIKEAEIDANLEFIQSHINKAVAVGEIGLDYHKKLLITANKDLQKRVLCDLLQITKDSDKPALLHTRYAWRDAFDLVKAVGLKKVVFHWFTGPSSVLRDIVEAGYYISVTPAVEYREEHRRAVKEAPLTHLLLETDSPVVYARGMAGEFKASPADVVRSLKGAAALKSLNEEELAAITTENATRLLGIMPIGRVKI